MNTDQLLNNALHAMANVQDEIVQVGSTYRIEKRSDAGPTLYWSEEFQMFGELLSRATIYTEAERRESLQRELRGEPNKFPSGGVWCVLDAEMELVV